MMEAEFIGCRHVMMMIIQLNCLNKHLTSISLNLTSYFVIPHRKWSVSARQTCRWSSGMHTVSDLSGLGEGRGEGGGGGGSEWSSPGLSRCWPAGRLLLLLGSGPNTFRT